MSLNTEEIANGVIISSMENDNDAKKSEENIFVDACDQLSVIYSGSEYEDDDGSANEEYLNNFTIENEEKIPTYVPEEVSGHESSDFVELTFSEYLEACKRASSSVEKLNLYFNRVILCNNGEKRPFVVRFPGNENAKTNISFTYDADAFIYGNSANVPINEKVRCNVHLSPPFSEHIKRLEFGSYQRGPDLINLKHLPHTLLFSANYGALLKCYIFFPELYDKGNEKNSFLSPKLQQRFVNDIFLPAVTNMCKNDVRNRMATSYGHSTGKGITLTTSDYLRGEDIDIIVPEMIEIIRKDINLSCYANFFFGSVAFGFKEPFHGDITSVLQSLIDWKTVDLTRVYIDIACNMTDLGRYSTFFLDHRNLRDVTFQYGIHENEEIIFYPAFLSKFGSLKVVPKTTGDNVPSKLIVYTNLKDSFTGFNDIDGKNSYLNELWKPADLWDTNNKTVNRINTWYTSRFEECKDKTFALRIEGRYKASTVNKKFINNLENAARNLYLNKCIVDLCTNEYLLFLELRHSFLITLVDSFRQKKNLQSLSGLVLLSYILSSLVLPANTSLYESRKYIDKYRCVHNEILFLPNSFTFREGRFHFSGCFPEKFLAKHFTSLFKVRRYINCSKVSSDIAAPISNPSSLIMPIKSESIRKLADQFLFSSSHNAALSALGTPYDGDNLYAKNQDSSRIYAEKAKVIFQHYGIGVESASRFAELFFTEYFSLVKKHLVSKYQESNCGISHLCYNSKHQPFIKVKKNDYLQNRSLDLRFSYLLPQVSDLDFGNVIAIQEKIKLKRNWSKFGSRAIFLQLYLNKGVSKPHLDGFRAFFFLIVHLFLEYIPSNNKDKILHVKNQTAMLQKTLKKKPSSGDDLENNKNGHPEYLVKAILQLSQPPKRSLKE